MPIAVVEEKPRGLPEDYLFLIANYIDSLKARTMNGTNASGKGMAAAYANPSLIEKEKSIFAFNEDDAVMAFVQKYKGSIHREIDAKSELAAYRNEKYRKI